LLLFIKMVHENTESGLLKTHPLPETCRLADHNDKDGLVLLKECRRILYVLSNGKDSEGNIIHDDPLIQAIYTDAHIRLKIKWWACILYITYFDDSKEKGY